MLQRNIDTHDDNGRGFAQYRADAHEQGGRELESLGAIIGIVRRNLWLIGVVTLACTFLSAVVALAISHQYKGTVVVFVDPHRTQVFKDRDLIGAPGPGTDNGIVESEAEIMKSPALLRKVVEQLDLLHDDEFADTSILGYIKSLVLLPIRLIFGSDANDDPVGVIAENLAKKIDTKRRTLTYVIDLNAWSVSPEKSARIANALAKNYLAQQVSAKENIASETNRWLSDQVKDYRARVEASDKAYEEYKAKSGLFDPGGENLADRQIAQLNDQLVAARGKAAEARAKYDELKKITPETLDSAASTSDALQSVVISNLRAQYADTSRHRSELVTRYGPDHPQVRVVQAQLGDLIRQIRDELNRIVAGARTEMEASASREATLRASVEELKDHVAKSNQASIRLHELERDAQANRDVFQAFLSRAKETAAQADVQLSASRIVSPATVPVIPSYPPRLLMVALGAFLGLGFGVSAAFAREAVSKGIRNVGEIEGGLGLPSIAAIPLVCQQRRLPPLHIPRRIGDIPWREWGRYVSEEIGDLVTRKRMTSPSLGSLALDEPESPFAESIRSLQFAFQRVAKERNLAVVLVTSALAGEGKSMISANLARALAKGSRVLLLDADFRHPSLASAFDIKNPGGLADMLRGRTDLAHSLYRDPRTGAYVIAGRASLPGTEAISVISSEEMRSLIAMVRDGFDVVIIDAAPLLPMADTRMLVELVDGVLMVVASDQTSKTDIASALHGSPGVEEKLVGVVLNKAVDDVDYYYNDRETYAARKRA